MGKIIGDSLPANVVRLLNAGKTVVAATVDADGWPNTAPMTWVVAKDEKTIRLAINKEIATYSNIAGNGRLTLSLKGQGMSLGVRGTAKIVKDQMKSVPFPCAMIEMKVEQVKDDNIIGKVGEEGIERWEDRRRLVSDVSVANELRE
ncbi:MAG: pyridoxamine 5'-phosphate oxidase family protein [Chloroflexi bacterium]|nr:pyridoxamine 5'-phosphate oxidase family protein [Chloroflexota bacterium]